MNAGKYLVYTVLFLVILGCSDSIDINPDDTATVLVVEGWITTRTSGNYIKLSKTVPYFSTLADPVSRAQVTVTDSEGDSYLFGEDPGQEGTYLPVQDFRARAGLTYHLEIKLNEQIGGETAFEASSTVTAINPVDSIQLKYHANWGTKGFYEVKCYYQDPEALNYYLCNLLVNNHMVTDSLTEKLVVDDQLFNGQYTYGIGAGFLNQAKADEALSPGDSVTFQLAGVSADLANFIWGVQQEYLPDNPFFGSAHASVYGNISGTAVGYFAACAVESATTGL